MKLTGTQVEQFHHALLDTFTEGELRQLLRTALDQNLDAVAGGTNLSEKVFNLIEWVERRGHTAQLLRAALEARPRNSELQTLRREIAADTPAGDDPESHDSPEIDTGGGAYVGGSAHVGGNLVGRDQHQYGPTYAPGSQHIEQHIYAAQDAEPHEAEPPADRRAQEEAYLERLIEAQEAWASAYIPLPAVVEVEREPALHHELNVPLALMNPEFAQLVDRGQGRVERQPVADLRRAIREQRRLVVLGEPGAGKTTTLRRLAHEYAGAALDDPAAPLPIYVELGGYSGAETAETYVRAAFGALGPHLSAYLEQKRAVLLLDALNEMPRSDYGERVARIQALLDAHREIPVVVTCRLLDYVETLDLIKVEIQPLGVARQRAYARRYLGDETGEAFFWQLVGGADAVELWQAWQTAGGTWEQFWTEGDQPREILYEIPWRLREVWRSLHRETERRLLDLGANPYLLAMMVQVYAEEGAIPQNRGQLFARFVAVLWGREEARYASRQAPAPWPGADVLIDALAALAFAMQEAGARGTSVERGWAEAQLPRTASPPAELLYLGASATLLDVSDRAVTFSHQLIQEYFAARAWQEQLAADDLRRYWPGGWLEPSGWEETAVLLAGILEEMTPLIEKLLPVHPVLAARCIGESGGACPESMVTRVRGALEKIAFGTQAPVQERNAAGDALNHVEDRRPGVGLNADGWPDIAWCAVPAGEFLMGNTAESDPMADGWEMPQHTVQLDAYHISRYPITNMQFAAFVEDGGYQDRRYWTDAGWQWRRRRNRVGPTRYGSAYDLPNHPVVGVTWYEAVAFCGWLSAKLGSIVRLPSEAQWEKAARGTDGRRYPWGDEATPEHANTNRMGIDTTSAVGIFPQGESPYGVLDMAGNVWEWTRSQYQPYPYDAADGRESETGAEPRTLRGGSFAFNDLFVRCAYRFSYFPNDDLAYVGFRVVVGLPSGL